MGRDTLLVNGAEIHVFYVMGGRSCDRYVMFVVGFDVEKRSDSPEDTPGPATPYPQQPTTPYSSYTAPPQSHTSE